jgi:hypothetical protein
MEQLIDNMKNELTGVFQSITIAVQNGEEGLAHALLSVALDIQREIHDREEEIFWDGERFIGVLRHNEKTCCCPECREIR